MSVSRQVNLNTAAQLFGKGLSLLFGIGTTIILRRLLGLQSFGDYIFLIAFITPFIALADFGTHLVSVTQASQLQKIQSRVLGNVLLLRPLISLLAVFIAGLVLWLFFKQQSSYALLFLSLPLIFLIAFKNSLVVVLHAKLLLYIASLQEILVAFLLFVAALGLALGKANLPFYVNLMIASYLLSVVVFSLVTFKKVKLEFKPNWAVMKKILIQSLPLAGILLLYNLYSRIDTFVLKFVWGSETVGIYGLAFKVYENLVLPAAFFMNAVLPLLARQVIKTSKEKVFPLLQKMADLLLAASLTSLLLIFIFSPLLISLFTGKQSWPEIVSLRILLFALPFAFLNHLCGYTIITIGQQKKSLLVSLVALFFNLLANLILIPRYSYVAAAGNVVATQALVLFFNLQIIKQKIKFNLHLFSWPKTTYQFIKLKGKVFDD